ncbi:hypothetical protein E0E54_02075 [Azotobacter chroococcum]|jgi:hypothetical protein|uniref:Uncharacterized protein n=2 Tax=Azotobacter chroococcum TaxID=353 RepID=A0A0C4WJ49_9GAMM|nr:hypothetical protein [Azotobacter chroococcum]AJE22488.1 Hypothetical protein Achr_30790 [Azotobacter chroococcum NCIMB 8003]ASL25677.1 hypothetical protein ACG10_04685 [Azotobacter chroococcum]MEE4462024.1 hypothetical protein [Azotobacter chroococcum]NHN76119.1 hypothetical protein [Azotobacter chroococcum]QQE89678.1 hypothetical protein GKQ51_04880 [Azotobacter chroococcum]
MSTLTELVQQIAQLYPLEDKRVGKRYRVVDELAGMTELEEVGGAPRYIRTAELKDRRLWAHAADSWPRHHRRGGQR